MRRVPEIKAALDWMVAAYEAQSEEAVAAGNALRISRLNESRDFLERGLFVILFGQFEQLVNDYFERARNARTANPDWTARRGWDVPAYADPQRVPFETKLALVFDRRHAAYGEVLRAYALRNHCAHGGTSESVGSMDQLVSNLYVWQGLLRR